MQRSTADYDQTIRKHRGDGEKLINILKNFQPMPSLTPTRADLAPHVQSIPWRAVVFLESSGPKSTSHIHIQRGYSKSNPNNVTSARNFKPKIVSAIHRLNHGPGESAAIKCVALVAPVTERYQSKSPIAKETKLTWTRPTEEVIKIPRQETDLSEAEALRLIEF